MIPWELALSFFVGLALLWALSTVLVWPRRIVWRLITSSLVSGLCLWAIDLLSPVTGLFVPLTPFTLLAAGALGLPGALVMAVWAYVLAPL